MKQVNLYEAKTQLSKLVDEAAAGEEIVIAKNGKPMAKLVNVDVTVKTPRKLGFWEGQGGWIADDFDAPDPELERLFYEGDVPSALDELVGVRRSPSGKVTRLASRTKPPTKKRKGRRRA